MGTHSQLQILLRKHQSIAKGGAETLGQKQLKPLQGLPRLVCQHHGFAPVKNPIDIKGTVHAGAITDIHVRREGQLKYVIFKRMLMTSFSLN